MDVLGAETVDGTDIRTWTDNGLSAQRYYIYNKFNSYYIRPVCSDKFVDMAIGTEDKNVATWGYGVDWEPQKFDITEVPEFIPGDINCDLSVSVADAVLLQKWLLGTSNATLENWKAGDLCKDNRIDVFDMIEMRKLLIQNK